MDYTDLHRKFEEFRVLNNEKNKYTINKVVSNKEIIKFENKHSIEVPIGLKYFVTNIANGIISNNSFISNIISKIRFTSYNSRSFRFNPSLEFKLEKRILGGYIDDDDKEYYPFETEYRYFSVKEYESFTNGHLTLRGEGCGAYIFIVVNGKEYNKIWFDNYVSNGEICPEFTLNPLCNSFTFEDWIMKELNIGIKILQK